MNNKRLTFFKTWKLKSPPKTKPKIAKITEIVEMTK